ncbi:unnamed protein product [Amaranthus hypochondriacus]
MVIMMDVNFVWFLDSCFVFVNAVANCVQKSMNVKKLVSLQGTKDRQPLGDRSVIQKRLEHSIPCSSESISNAFGKRSMMDNYTFNNHLKNIRKSISKIQRESFDYLDSLQFYNLLCKKSLDLENKKIKRFSRKSTCLFLFSAECFGQFCDKLDEEEKPIHEPVLEHVPRKSQRIRNAKVCEQRSRKQVATQIVIIEDDSDTSS